jgi:hypothetical protein
MALGGSCIKNARTWPSVWPSVWPGSGPALALAAGPALARLWLWQLARLWLWQLARLWPGSGPAQKKNRQDEPLAAEKTVKDD